MNADDFDYPFPPELIAQEPAPSRDQSRLLILDREDGCVRHDRFQRLPEYLRAGDALVLNDTKVRPARLLGAKESGGKVEVLLVRRLEGKEGEAEDWECLIPNAGRLRPESRLFFAEEVEGRIGGRTTAGFWRLNLRRQTDLEGTLKRIGYPPLPPYIKRRGREDLKELDLSRYQTVYARNSGAIAAPTAGLHFTPEVLEKIRGAGVRTVFLTLHVGVGTFLPVKTARVEDHRLEPEIFDLPAGTAEVLNGTKEAGGRIVAVGTTVVRTLETLSDEEGRVQPGAGRTGLFILPGHRFRAVDAMVTNFHLPRSTLLMLVSAFAGRERILAAYGEAVRERYRFYSYGDAMLIT
jgi:S-adenosylmethionine:tRNA ribosyltransferase-isomerase